MLRINSISFLLDLLFPRHNCVFTSINQYLTKTEALKLFSFNTKPLDEGLSKNLEEVFFCSSFKNLLISDLIHRAKFLGELAICDDLVKVIGQAFEKNLLPRPDFLISVPPDPKRFRQRSYHIPYILTQKLGKLYNISVLEIFTKQFSTKAQSELQKVDRINNLTGAFSLNDLHNLDLFENVFIIDDVTTTGSTFTELAKTLRSKHPNLKVHGLALAG